MRRVRWRAAGFISPIRMERCFWGVTGASSCHAAGFVSLSRTEMYLRPVQRRILLAGQPAHFLLSRRRVISLCRMQTRHHAVLRRIFLCCAECKCAFMPCRGENILPRLSRCVSYCRPLPRRRIHFTELLVCLLPHRQLPSAAQNADSPSCLAEGENILPVRHPLHSSPPAHHCSAAFTSGHCFDGLSRPKRNKKPPVPF